MDEKQKGLTAAGAQPEVKLPGSKKKRRWLKVLLVLGAVAAAVGIFIVRPMLTASRQMNDLLYIRATAEYRDVTVTVSGTAAVEPWETSRVTAAVQGEILSAPFEEGEYVNAGEVLVEIDAESAETALQRAQIQAEQARLSYENVLESRDKSLRELDIKAGGAGTVWKLYVKEGDSVSMGSPLAEIVDRTKMKLTVPFHSADASGFAPGQSAQVQVGRETLEGRVDSLSAVDRAETGGILVRDVTILVENPGALSAASTGTARVGGVDCAGAGTFQEAEHATVTARTTGKVEELYVEEGDTVAGDQLLGRFEAADMDYQVENARLSLRSAELSVQSAREQLSSYTVTAPISGTVAEKNCRVGDKLEGAAMGASLAVIYDLEHMTFEMKIDELYITKLRPGQEVRVTADALEGREFTGRVSRVGINGTTMNGVTTYPVTVELLEARDLMPGMNVSAEILIERAEGVLTVPVEMVSRGNVVQVLPSDAVDQNGAPDYSRLEERTVALGRNDEDNIEILSGLAPGETVVRRTEATSILEQMMAMGGRR